MKYVIDVNAAAFWVLPSPFTPKAIRLRDDYRRGVHELIAPVHFLHELANALTKAERQKLIPIGSARRLIQDVLTTPPVHHAIDDPLFYRAIDISSQTRSAFYDTLYVALAEREGCELITADTKLIHNLQPHFPFIVPLSSLP